MKRFIALFLCFVLLVFSVGCGKNEPTNTDSNTTSTTEDNIFDDLFNDNTTTTSPISQTENTTNNTETSSVQEESTTKTEDSVTKKEENTTKVSETTTRKQEVVTKKQETTTKVSETTTKKQETTTNKIETTTKQPIIDTSIKSIKTKEYKTNSATQTVYYPDNIDLISKPYPVIAWANGTMVTSGFYDKLLIEIAKGGYIVVACDETMSADGTAQIASIDFILSKNNDKNDIFYNKIDTNNIGVMGHSQGGRSSVNAAVADSRIDCVVSIAGSNYTSEIEGLNKPTFFIAGTNDLIVLPSQWIVPAYETANCAAVYASLNGGIHTTCSTNPEKYSGYIIDWFDGWLKEDFDAIKNFTDGDKLSNDSAWVDFRCKNFGVAFNDKYDHERVF